MTKARVFRTLFAFALMSTGAACTVHNSEAPALTGPSTFALSISLNAIPDAVNQDGGSQSSIRVTALGPTGRPISGLSLRMDMAVLNDQGVYVPQDYGTLSARTIVTGSDGVASVVYTAPPSSPGGILPSGIQAICGSLPGTCVSIVATPYGTGFEAAIPQSVKIRLVPIGVILPPAKAPTAQFTFTPALPQANSPVAFDASTSCGGDADTSGCLPSNFTVVSYSWLFGDGSSGSGVSPTHTFSSPGTYTVELTVINDRGIQASTRKPVTVGAGARPTAAFVFGPTPANVGQDVFFDATQSVAAPGHTIVRYKWNFGDGTLKESTTATTQHDWASPGTFTVRLTVVDEAGQEGTVTQSITVGSGNPTASFTVAKSGGTSVTVDGNASTAAPGSTIASYDWLWGDGTSSTGAVETHTYPLPGTYTITLTVTDSTGRTGRATQNITVP